MVEQTTVGAGAILALAGRRIDKAGARPARFPLTQVDAVRRRLRALFAAESAVALVCSAACGADLVALDEAGEFSIRRRVVLPFSKEKFRETSVVDRPGDWGDLFDRVIGEVEAKGDLVVLRMTADNGAPYEAASKAIIREAQAIDSSAERAAVVVWEGQPRSGSDVTEAFRALAAKAGFSQRVVLTL